MGLGRGQHLGFTQGGGSHLLWAEKGAGVQGSWESPGAPTGADGSGECLRGWSRGEGPALAPKERGGHSRCSTWVCAPEPGAEGRWRVAGGEHFWDKVAAESDHGELKAEPLGFSLRPWTLVLERGHGGGASAGTGLDKARRTLAQKRVGARPGVHAYNPSISGG